MKRLANVFITAATTVAMLTSTCPTAAIAAEVLPSSETTVAASAEESAASSAEANTNNAGISTDSNDATAGEGASTSSSAAKESAESESAPIDAAANDEAATGAPEDANTDEPANTADNAATEDGTATAGSGANDADEATLATVELNAEDDFTLETWNEGIDAATADGDEVSDAAQNVLGKVLDAYESCSSSIEFQKSDNITAADVRAAMALAFSSAEYYWAATSYSLGYYDANKNGEAEDDEIAAAIYFSYYFSASEVPTIKQATEAKIAEALSWIDEDEMSAFEVAQALHDYLVRTCVYDLTAETATGPTVSHSAYGALTKGTAVCQGYALAYKLLLTRVGVPCVFVTSTSMNHAWNMVQIDGGWYHVDSTWDDPVYSDGTDAGFDVDVSHRYFLRADSTMSTLGHSGWEAAYTTPTSDYINRTYAEYKAPVSTSGSGSGGTTDGGSDGESGETSGEGSSGGTPSEASTNGHAYAHSATASASGVTFTVQWDDSTTAGEATTFHVTQTGGSSSAKARMDVPTYWDNGSQESVCDPTRGDWGTYHEVGDGYDFTFDLTASGTYRIYFYFMDQPNSIYYLRTVASVEVSDSARPSVSQIVADAVAQAKQETDGSEYAMALWLHDWTLNQLKYDYDLNYCSAESGLTRAKGTCESYQRIYAKLLDIAGIANGRITGNGHTWNAVKIDGKWCQMDLTWDDSSDNWYGDFDQRHIYFGLTDELMAIAHSDHETNYQAEDYAYRSSDLSNNYFARNGKADEWANAYLERIQEHLDAGETSFSIDADNASYPPGICGIQNGIVAAMLNQRTWATSDGTKVELTATSKVTTESSTKWTAVLNFEATYEGTAISIANAQVSAPVQAYTGSALTPELTVTLGGKTLKQGSDYTFGCYNNINVGTANITVVGKGNYAGTATGTFKIVAGISKATIKAADQTYTGSALTPEPTVILNGKTLKQGTDYTVSYSSNINAGTATITATGKGNYTGTARGTFRINAANASKATVKAANQTYTGSALKPAATVTLGGKTLKQGTDYTVAYSNNTNAGTATVTVTGKGNYTGTAKGTFKINAANASKATVKAASQTYTGRALTPAPTVTFNGKTLKQGTDYTVAYSNNTSAGTATVTVTGKGNYTSTAKGAFKINAANASKATVKAASQTYTGRALTPAPTVTFNGKTLKQGTDYTVSYANNTNIGTATVTATFKGNYTGTASAKFAINEKSAPTVAYQAHVQNIGWQSAVRNGATAGTSGRSLRVEAVKLWLENAQYSGGIQIRAHVQNIGWQNWSTTGGTSGKSLRVEAMQIRLTGELANHYDVYYRVHAQNFGWMGWAKNGEQAGSSGYSYRLEAIQIKLVAKGGSAPGSTANRFRSR